MRVALTWPKPATALSVLGHAVFLALLTIEAPRHIATVKLPPAVEVTMITSSERLPSPTPSTPAAGTASVEPLVSAPSSQPSLPSVEKPPRPSGRITATDYFAGAVLSDPRNKETRETLATLGGDERLIQLCNIEAMEQLKRWKAGFVPNHIVAYAISDPSMTATRLEAPGAAVHAAGKWYRLSFNCSATTDLERVTSFDFRLGGTIPQREWEQDSLPELVEGEATD